MQGFWRMFTGEGGQFYKEQHQAFQDALPDDFPFVVGCGDGAMVRYGAGGQDWRPATCEDVNSLPSHPAYNSNIGDAMNYRRARYCHGPMPKGKPEDVQQYEAIHDAFYEYVADARENDNEPMMFLNWLKAIWNSTERR